MCIICVYVVYRLRAASFDTNGGVGSTFDTGVYQVGMRFDEVCFVLLMVFVNDCLCFIGVPFADS